MTEERLNYEAAGVSLAVAESVVDRLRTAVESTGATGFGAFAALHPLGDGRFLAASTDGVGSKLVLARRAGRLRWCGVDLAAHCINDVITTGAEPLLLLDYVAATCGCRSTAAAGRSSRRASATGSSCIRRATGSRT